MNPELKQNKFERPETREAAAERPVEVLKEREQSLFQKTAKFLENLPGKVLESSREAKAVAAFTLLLKASTLFTEAAWAQETKKYAPAELGAKPAAEFVLKKESPLEAPFDWKKIVNEINVSFEAPYIPKKEFETEEVNIINTQFQNTEFYKDFSKQEAGAALKTYFQDVKESRSAQEFFNGLKENAQELTGTQKVYLLQQLGWDLAKTYNYDMLTNDAHVEISDDQMFQALKNRAPGGTGICGNIHTFMVKAAEQLGVEAWLQSGFTSQTGHVWMGAVAERQGKKEIVFVDYNNLIPTGTLNYKEALGIMERRNKEIALFNSFIGDTKEVLFPVKSYAQEVMEKAAGFEDINKGLSAKLEAGEIKRQRSLEIKFSPESREIKFGRDHVGLYYLNYQDSGNAYNSLEELNALRGTLRLGGKKIDVESDVTVMHFDVKDLGTKLFPRDAIAGRLAAHYVDSRRLTKGEYGSFALNYGATLEGGIAHFLQEGTSASKTSGKGEGGLGIRLMYLNPNETGKMFLEVQDAWRGTLSDFQNQDVIAQEILRKIAAGGTYKVNEGTIVNLETALAQLDYGQNYLLKGGVTRDNVRTELSWLKEISDYERFRPSKEVVEGSVGYQFALSKSKERPIGEINVFGSTGKETYQDAPPQKVQNVGVKLRLILW